MVNISKLKHIQFIMGHPVLGNTALRTLIQSLTLIKIVLEWTLHWRGFDAMTLALYNNFPLWVSLSLTPRDYLLWFWLLFLKKENDVSIFKISLRKNLLNFSSLSHQLLKNNNESAAFSAFSESKQTIKCCISF